MKKYNLNLYNLFFACIIIYFFHLKIFYFQSDLWSDEQFSYWLINPIINFEQFFYLIFKFDIFQISFNLLLKLLFYVIPYNVENSIILIKLFSVGSIILIFFISKNYLIKKNALMITALFSSVFILNFLSDEIRSYNFSVFTLIFSFYFYLNYKNNNSKIDLIFFIILSFISATSQLFAVLFTFSILIYELIQYSYKKNNKALILSLLFFLLLIIFYILLALKLSYIDNRTGAGDLNVTALLSLYLPFYLGLPLIGRLFSLILFINIFYYLKNFLLKFDYNLIFIIHLIITFLTVIVFNIYFGADVIHPKHLLFTVISSIFLISNIDLKKFDNLKKFFLSIYLLFSAFQNFSLNQNADLSYSKIFVKVQESNVKDYFIKTDNSYDLKIKYRNINLTISNPLINYISNSKFFDKKINNILNREDLENNFWLICDLDISKCINDEVELIQKFDVTKIINENNINAYLLIKK